MRRAKIITGKYKGVYGECTEVNKYGNVMFYPDNSTPVYCVCRNAKEVEYIDK